MKTFKPSALSIALMLGGLQLAAIPNYAIAAEAPQATETTEDANIDEAVEVIEVTCV
jgi:hypothetical protein